MTDFWTSDAGKHAAVAKAFLEAAVTLDEARADKGSILFMPTLALAGHGLELMLKACIYLTGGAPKKTHDIAGLWNEDACEPVRGHVFANARVAVKEARQNYDYLGIPEDKKVRPLIEEYIAALCNLHGGKGYVLRYPSESETEAPRTPFLVRTLHLTADDLVKRPSDFEINNFSDLA